MGGQEPPSENRSLPFKTGELEHPSQKISEILPLHSGVIVVLSNKWWELVFFSG